MTKRIQIPVSPSEAAALRSAARRAGLLLAEWARRLLRERAEQEIGGSRLDPATAVEILCGLEAPIEDIDTMIAESIRGRYE